MKKSRYLLTYLAILAIIIIRYSPLHLPFVSALPDVPLLYVIYASIYCSSSLFIFSSLLMGILNDLIAGNIIGITAIQYAVLITIVHSTIKHLGAKSFHAIWLRASVLILIATSIRVLTYHHLYSLWAIDMQMLFVNIVSIFSYPAAHSIFSKCLKVNSKVADA